MRRRDLIAMLGAAAVWPLAARAQQGMPVIGFLGSTSPDKYAVRLTAFHQGLKEAGYVEGQSVAIEYRWAEGHYERLPALAAELVQRPVAVIASGGGAPSALAAKAATSTIPVVFASAVDPVQAGIVASLSRPGGNVTGVTSQNVDLGPKRLEMLRELLPKATAIAVLVNPGNAVITEQFMGNLEATARALGMTLDRVQAQTEHDLEGVFAGVAQFHADALVINSDVFFSSRSEELAQQALRHALPAIYEYREFAAAGGLVSYGASEAEYYRLLGAQVGKVLRGKQPADLPVEQTTMIELIINLRTAKALGITVPLALTARADELIE